MVKFVITVFILMSRYWSLCVCTERYFNYFHTIFNHKTPKNKLIFNLFYVEFECVPFKHQESQKKPVWAPQICGVEVCLGTK